MEYQEYISLLEAFRLSLTAENNPNVVQIVDQINETVDCKIKLNTLEK